MSKIKLAGLVAILALTLLFVLSNPEKAEVNVFWMARPETSVAHIALFALAIGMAAMALLDLPGRFRAGKNLRDLRSSLKSAEEERALLLKRVEELSAKPADGGEQGK
ncbi:MAG TPA: LapA family protein [bacterium]|nr:MAG: hypothetical protein BWY28_02910 [bacterium ADurb.Bin236]HOY63897.1 LapA family protein [bacterium]HPI77988.1 LapA family protein [bacterium]HPN95352.1 LapA family protein [bacterium]